MRMNPSFLWGSYFILSLELFSLRLFYISAPSTGEIHGYREEIDAELESSRPKLRGVYAAYTKGGEWFQKQLRCLSAGIIK